MPEVVNVPTTVHAHLEQNSARGKAGNGNGEHHDGMK